MIQFTNSAIEKVQYFLENAKQPNMVLRIIMQSDNQEERSFQFKLEPEESFTSKDLTMPSNGFHVRMDSLCAIKLTSSTVDWQEKDGKAGFTVVQADEYDPAESKDQSIQDQIKNILKTIYDPEIPVNIYDMGLIYNFDVTKDGKVNVLMTLTAPNCPVAEVLPDEVKTKILSIPEVKEVDLSLTWEPAWTPELMTEEARLELGM